ncbi:hypothetical protein tb265_42920 [Gemmatimonadetes bacterium T265]|nr:hypothetical protein tb265_42920 [Gemmatimonadetes bacterium T265]
MARGVRGARAPVERQRAAAVAVLLQDAGERGQVLGGASVPDRLAAPEAQARREAQGVRGPPALVRDGRQLREHRARVRVPGAAHAVVRRERPREEPRRPRAVPAQAPRPPEHEQAAGHVAGRVAEQAAAGGEHLALQTLGFGELPSRDEDDGERRRAREGNNILASPSGGAV